MGMMFACSLKSAICLALFYLFYKALLSKETFHRFNRILLLVVIGLAAGIPFLVTHSISSDPSANLFYTAAERGGTGILPAGSPENESAPQDRLLAFVLIIYIAGICFCLLRNIAGIIHILWIIRKGKQIACTNNVKIIIHDDNRIAPFSWMSYIVMSQTDMDEAGETILLHEQAHIRHRHTIDLFLAGLCTTFQWYNPGAWLLHRELQAIHEYEADETVINQGIEAKQYQLLLIKKAVGSRHYSMANSFNHSNLKKRITMMLQKKSNAWARLKYAYILPLAAVAIAAFARPEISRPFDEISSVKVSNFIATTDPGKAGNAQNELLKPGHMESLPEESVQPAKTTDETGRNTAGSVNVENNGSEAPFPAETIHNAVQTISGDTTVYTVVDVMPEFPGGQSALMKFINENIIYPQQMQKDGIQGRVIVAYTVMKDGSVRNAKIVKSLCPEADAEAIRLVKTMPKWTPGKLKGKVVNVEYTIPLTFRLQN